MTETPMIFNCRRLLRFAAATGTAPDAARQARSVEAPGFAVAAATGLNPLGTTNYVNPINRAPTSPPPPECEGVDK